MFDFRELNNAFSVAALGGDTPDAADRQEEFSLGKPCEDSSFEVVIWFDFLSIGCVIAGC